ncbi:MAG: ANTAR domain-containing protein [Gaiellaceae bacterium]
MAQVGELALRRLLDLNAQLRERAEQLETALESRIVIEQAKGILAERYRVGVDGAFDVLRRASRTSRVPLHTLARRVVQEAQTPAELVEQIR